MTGWELDDTIAAIASAPGGSMRGIIRISGPAMAEVCDRVLSLTPEQLAPSSPDPSSQTTDLSSSPTGNRLARVSDIRTNRTVRCSIQLDGVPLAAQLLLWPTRRSYTRQPTAELHTIGSPPLLQKILRMICNSGARLAGPGEFTLRAFLSGRIDLTQAEAVLGVIDSRSREMLDDSLRQLAGGLSGPLNEIRDRMLALLAELEAGLDFVEEDIEFISKPVLLNGLTEIDQQLTELMSGIDTRDRTGAMPRVVLAGPPNAGKSSLFNAISDHQQAIVSGEPGTTRDFISARIEADGVEFELIDTAGIPGEETDERESAASNTIESRAHDFSTDQFRQADHLLVCFPAGSPREEVDRFMNSIERDDPRVIHVQTKCDLTAKENATDRSDVSIRTSSTGQPGIAELQRAIVAAVRENRFSSAGFVPATATRALLSLQQSKTAVESAIKVVQADIGEEVVAAELRTALDGLGQVVGTVYTDDILDRIFSQFCIGK